MARSTNKDTLALKIKKIEQAIGKNREQYERLTAELEELHQKQKAIRTDELLKAVEASTKSYDEILRFIQNESESKETEEV